MIPSKKTKALIDYVTVAHLEKALALLVKPKTVQELREGMPRLRRGPHDILRRLVETGWACKASGTISLTPLGAYAHRIYTKDPSSLPHLAHIAHYLGTGREYFETYRLISDTIYETPDLRNKLIAQRILRTLKEATHEEFGFDVTSVHHGLRFLRAAFGQNYAKLSEVRTSNVLFCVRTFQVNNLQSDAPILLSKETSRLLSRALFVREELVQRLIELALRSIPEAKMFSSVWGVAVHLP